MKTNIVELATDLADMAITHFAKEKGVKEDKMFYEEEETQYYTEEYQEQFENWYNTFFQLLENQGYKNECV